MNSQNRIRVLDAAGVRAGTPVWVAGAWRSDARPDLLPPFTGGSRGGVRPALQLTPIEHLRPNDLIIAHDGLPDPVLRVIKHSFEGEMVTLQTDRANSTLALAATHRVLAKLRPRTLGGDRDWNASPEFHRERRRELRREATVAERKLWSVLRRSTTGFKFRRQHSLGPYIADFYSREAHLVVEIDGDSHYTPAGRAHDRRRDAFLRRLGLDVLRVTVDDVDTNLEGVWQAIQNQCRMRTEAVGDARWVQAGSLLPGDIVFGIRNSGEVGAESESIGTQTPSLNPPVDGGKEGMPPQSGGISEPRTSRIRRTDRRSRPAGTPNVPPSVHGWTQIPPPVHGGTEGGLVELNQTLLARSSAPPTFTPIPLAAATITSVTSDWSSETLYKLEIADTQAIVTETCAIYSGC